MEKKKNYEVPGLTVVTFKTERGYAASGDPKGSGSKSLSDGLFEKDKESQQSLF